MLDRLEEEERGLAELQYDLTADDILSYWRYLYQHSRPFRAQYWLGFMLAPKRAFHQAGTTIEQFRETVNRHRAGGPTTR